MAIDIIIDYQCVPKETLGTEGILERLKGQERAEEVIRLFRRNDDDRPPSKMGFEFTRSTPDGQEETRLIVVQGLLDEAEELKPLESYCEGCPANVGERPFGCMSFIQYPVSGEAEAWLLDRLPVPDEPLVWLLLKQGVQEFQYDGKSVTPMRAVRQDDGSGVYFEAEQGALRRLGEIEVTADQVFEMIFGVGHINPNHAGILLLFFLAIDRDLDAKQIMRVSSLPANAKTDFPLTIKDERDDDRSIREFKAFLRALYRAWALGMRLLVDA